MSRSSSARRRLLAASLVALGAAACAGPREPLSVGIREVANNIVIGAPGAPLPAPAPLPQMVVPVIPPVAQPIVVPPAIPETRPEPPVPTVTPEPPCAAADPLAIPALDAPTDHASPAAAGAFLYRTVGERARSGANAHESTIDADLPRLVSEPRQSAGGFEFDVISAFDGVTTIVTYQVVNVGPAEDVLTGLGRDEDVLRGVFITTVYTEEGTSSALFNPNPKIQILPFPAFPGDTFSAAGVDARDQMAMSFDGTVVGKERVNACGELIDAVVVDLANGRFTSPTANITFTQRLWLATQFGGMPVADAGERNGLDGLDAIYQKASATINQVPRQASP